MRTRGSPAHGRCAGPRRRRRVFEPAWKSTVVQRQLRGVDSLEVTGGTHGARALEAGRRRAARACAMPAVALPENASEHLNAALQNIGDDAAFLRLALAALALRGGARYIPRHPPRAVPASGLRPTPQPARHAGRGRPRATHAAVAAGAPCPLC